MIDSEEKKLDWSIRVVMKCGVTCFVYAFLFKHDEL